MAGQNEMFQWQPMSGQAVRIGDRTLTPQSQALTLGGPFGGLVWNRPVAVLVEGPDGAARRIPIVDVTRAGQLAMLGLGLACFLIGLVFSKEGSQ